MRFIVHSRSFSKEVIQMALSKYATPEEAREYKRKRRIAWVGTYGSIALGIVSGIVEFKFHSPAAIFLTVLALVVLISTGVWANNHGVAD